MRRLFDMNERVAELSTKGAAGHRRRRMTLSVSGTGVHAEAQALDGTGHASAAYLRGPLIAVRGGGRARTALSVER